MTRLLIDTHVLLWLLLTPDRIPDRTRKQLSDPTADVSVSAASAWEIAAKYRLGKLAGAESVVRVIRSTSTGCEQPRCR